MLCKEIITAVHAITQQATRPSTNGSLDPQPTTHSQPSSLSSSPAPVPVESSIWNLLSQPLAPSQSTTTITPYTPMLYCDVLSMDVICEKSTLTS